MWAALPPLDWWPLAWIAPIPWLLLARLERLPGRRPYAALWLAGFVFWMAALHWLRLPHWATSFGWVALSFYLAFYIPVFVGLVRVGIHRLHWPLALVAPVVWTGLELVRAYLLTGFSMGSLSHTQSRWLALIQISDVTGGYGVSFVVMLVAAALAGVWPPAKRRAWAAVPVAALAVVACLTYGAQRMQPPTDARGPQIALIQGSIDTMFDGDPERTDRILAQYRALTAQALKASPNAALVVWPESMYPHGWLTAEADADGGPDHPAFTAGQLRAFAEDSREGIERLAREVGLPMVVNAGRQHVSAGGRVDFFNTAILVDPQRGIVAWYDKMHPVMFGEYIPFGGWLPWLYRLTPLQGGLTPGAQAKAFPVAGLTACPSVCYETVLPQVIRRQVRQLEEQGTPSDFLLNVTNDGWFWGSSELEMHLVCSVFRAVEMRKPLLIAANTGISAAIDGDGRILARGPRRAQTTLTPHVQPDGRHSFYRRWGDWFAGGCLAITGVIAAVGTRQAFRSAPFSVSA
ncbi:MAG: apolipoprotein N-acyltransferase [Pirellulales bacterium]